MFYFLYNVFFSSQLKQLIFANFCNEFPGNQFLLVATFTTWQKCLGKEMASLPLQNESFLFAIYVEVETTKGNSAYVNSSTPFWSLESRNSKFCKIGNVINKRKTFKSLVQSVRSTCWVTLKCWFFSVWPNNNYCDAIVFSANFFCNSLKVIQFCLVASRRKLSKLESTCKICCCHLKDRNH